MTTLADRPRAETNTPRTNTTRIDKFIKAIHPSSTDQAFPPSLVSGNDRVHPAHPPPLVHAQHLTPALPAYLDPYDSLLPQSPLHHSLDQPCVGFASPPQPDPHDLPAYQHIENPSFVQSNPPHAQPHSDRSFLTTPVHENLHPAIPLHPFAAPQFVTSPRYPHLPSPSSQFGPSSLEPSVTGPPASPRSPPTVPPKQFHPRNRLLRGSLAHSTHEPDVDAELKSSDSEHPGKAELEQEKRLREERVWNAIVAHGQVKDGLQQAVTQAQKKLHTTDRDRTKRQEKAAIEAYEKWLGEHHLTGSTDFQRFRAQTKGPTLKRGHRRAAQQIRMERVRQCRDAAEDTQRATSASHSAEETNELEKPLWEAVREHAQVLFRFEGRQGDYKALTEAEKADYQRELKKTTDQETRARRKYERSLNGNLESASRKYLRYRELYKGHRLGGNGIRQEYHEWRRAQLQR
ncbi:hypothetical protein JCM16303_006894 [Sporobolomyces ruberrimus]